MENTSSHLQNRHGIVDPKFNPRSKTPDQLMFLDPRAPPRPNVPGPGLLNLPIAEQLSTTTTKSEPSLKTTIQVTLICANGLSKTLHAPSTFAIIRIDEGQAKITKFVRKTRHPRWDHICTMSITHASILSIIVYDLDVDDPLGRVEIPVGDEIGLWQLADPVSLTKKLGAEGDSGTLTFTLWNYGYIYPNDAFIRPRKAPVAPLERSINAIPVMKSPKPYVDPSGAVVSLRRPPEPPSVASVLIPNKITLGLPLGRKAARISNKSVPSLPPLPPLPPLGTSRPASMHVPKESVNATNESLSADDGIETPEATSTAGPLPNSAVFEIPPEKSDSCDSTDKDLGSIAVKHGLMGAHLTYAKGTPPPFHQIRQLGHGSLGSVDEVQVPNSVVTLARKTVKISGTLRSLYMEIVEQEVKTLRTLSNCHIVRVVGTYEFSPSYAILMTPVGDRNLKDMLEEFYERDHQDQERNWLMTWFFCLASALEYIHSKGVRHEDIKPANIVHRGKDIYLTDFSSCTEFELGKTTSTDTPAGRVTRIYSAPEVLEEGRHGRAADVFSMGCVFAEMATVFDSKDVSDLYTHCSVKRRGSNKKERLLYSQALEKLEEWFNGPFYQTCIKLMLAEGRKERPTAAEVLPSLNRVFGSSQCLCMREAIRSTQTTLPSIVSEVQLIPSWASLLIVGIEHLLLNPHACSKGAACAKQRQMAKLQSNLSIGSRKDSSALVGSTNFYPTLENAPSLIVSSDVLGPGHLRVYQLSAEAMADVKPPHARELVKKYLKLQNLSTTAFGPVEQRQKPKPHIVIPRETTNIETPRPQLITDT